MASMAAAVAAARSASGVNRPLDERERQRFSYFSSLSPMARKIMLDKERVRQRAGPAWERMEPRQQEQLIDQSLLQPQLQARYARHRGAPGEPASAYPSLRLHTGQKLVRFGEEDITWQDEHSAPFSWETRSQMEFSVASLPTQEQSSVPQLPTEQRQPAKMVQGGQAPKVSHVVQSTKPSQGSKTPSLDGPPPARKEEESTFWKISAERSRIEGEETEFQSLTPSQIKSLEKGEKALPSYFRQESGSKDKEAMKVEKPTVSKPEKPTAQTVFSSASPNKASAAYPSVVSAAYPAATSASFENKAASTYQSVTSAAYSAVTSAASPIKASAAYPSVYSAAYPAMTSPAYSSVSSPANPTLVSAASQSVPPTTTEREKPRPSQSSVSTLDDVFLPEVPQQTMSVTQTLSNDAIGEKGDAFLPDQQMFSEINTSNVVLKTGFDFLDNW